MITPANLAPVFDIIEKAYSGPVSSPTEDQKKQIEQSLAGYDLTGRVCMGGGTLGLAISYFAWKIPYIGPVCGIIIGGPSIVSTIYGYDIFQCGKNLDTFVKQCSKINFSILLSGKEQEIFRKSLLDKAVEGTLVLRGFLSYAIVQQKA